MSNEDEGAGTKEDDTSPKMPGRLKGSNHMHRSRQSTKRLILAITMVFALPTALVAQVRVLMSGGFSAAYQELLPEFEKSTGITVTTARGASQGDGPTTIGTELRGGHPPTWSSCRGKGSPSYQRKVESLEVQMSISPASRLELVCVPANPVRISAR